LGVGQVGVSDQGEDVAGVELGRRLDVRPDRQVEEIALFAVGLNVRVLGLAIGYNGAHQVPAFPVGN
jgi:hypothetical protein